MQSILLNRQKEKGFSLIEAFLAISIFIIISSAILGAYWASRRFYQQGGAKAELLQNGRIIFERIIREARQAKTIAISLPNEESLGIDEILFEDGHINQPYHYIHYFQTNGEIKRRVIGFYFSGDPNQDLMPFNAVAPEGQTLEIKIIDEEKIIGELVDYFRVWQSQALNFSLLMSSEGETIKLQTGVFIRNL
jgi:type II secretory pathway component PulJ